MRKKSRIPRGTVIQSEILLTCLVVLCTVIGCRTASQVDSEGDYFQSYLTQIEYPEIDQASMESAQESLAARPPSVAEYEQLEFEDITLDEAIQLALTNSKVLSRIGGQVVNLPAGAITTLDPAIQESSLNGVEQALGAFDARWDTVFNFNRSERKFNNLFFGQGAQQLITNASNFNSGITKQTAIGSTFGLRNIIDYQRNNSPVNRFGSAYDWLVQAEYRQSLLRGAGVMVNQIAGPNPQPGLYNGVLIARINQDLSLADFEASVRDLVREVERNYWELYFAYRNLDYLLEGRKATLENWRFRKVRDKAGLEDKHVVPQARQQYFDFEAQVQNALAGNGLTPGLYGAERELRRLIGLNAGGTQLLRPSTDPLIAKAEYDWDSLQLNALERRVELRRQQWVVKQRELEYLAARNLNRWTLDFVANYGWRGFGDNLAGSRDRPEGSALEDLFSGDLDEWNMGFEFGGPIGKRQTFVAVQNAELQLAKARAVLKEQQRQVILNLNRAFVEVDRAYEGIRSNYNSREAIEEEVEVRRKTREGGLDDPFFYLEALRRRANTESAFARALVDYNLALLDIAFESGQLLPRYNIQLAEGPWSEDAYANAAQRDLRFSE